MTHLVVASVKGEIGHLGPLETGIPSPKKRLTNATVH